MYTTNARALMQPKCCVEVKSDTRAEPRFGPAPPHAKKFFYTKFDHLFRFQNMYPTPLKCKNKYLVLALGKKLQSGQ